MTAKSTTQIVRKITLAGITDIMFDRYPGDNNTSLEPHQKLYYDMDGKSLVIPAANVLSLLSGLNTTSAPKRFMDSRKYKAVCQAILGYTSIEPMLIPLMRDGLQIQFYGFDGDLDPKAKIYVDRRVARLDKGIPNPKVRPVVQLPWEIAFTMRLFKNAEVTEEQLKGLLIKGGMAIGLGTYRGLYGKFIVSDWAEVDD